MKKIVFLALTLVLLLASTSAFAAFSDVTQDDWAYEEITAMAELGIAVAEENGNLNPSESLNLLYLDSLPDWTKQYTSSLKATISPLEDITRAEFVSAIVKAINATSSYTSSSFSDMADDVWYAKDVECAKTIGLIKGYEDGTFRGDEAISKREALVVSHRLNAFLEALSK